MYELFSACTIQGWMQGGQWVGQPHPQQQEGFYGSQQQFQAGFQQGIQYICMTLKQEGYMYLCVQVMRVGLHMNDMYIVFHINALILHACFDCSSLFIWPWFI